MHCNANTEHVLGSGNKLGLTSTVHAASGRAALALHARAVAYCAARIVTLAVGVFPWVYLRQQPGVQRRRPLQLVKMTARAWCYESAFDS